MKFRTEIKIRHYAASITLADRILTLGSCFAEEIGRWLAEHKYRVVCNPTGPLFNPLSIHRLLTRALKGEPHSLEEVQSGCGENHFLYDHSTRLTNADPIQLLTEANALLGSLSEAFTASRHLLLTFGTAWVYRLREKQQIVANCHKQPQNNFERTRLTVEEIVDCWKPFFEQHPDKLFTLTVSPIRHLGDGLEENALSKSILRVACAELAELCPNVHYFPAYEILLDDLRDYRFYADDLCHPSTQAVAYIAERFAEAALDPQELPIAEEAARLATFVKHRPLHPESEAYRSQCTAMIARMKQFPEVNKIDFSEEIAALKRNL